MGIGRRLGALGLAAIASCSLVAARAAAEESTTIDPQVRAIIERMGRHLDSLKAFRIVGEAISDEVDEETGTRLQFGAAIEATLERKNHLRITHRTAQERQEFFYDGERFTLHDVEENVYGTLPFKGNVGEALEHAHAAAGVVPPLADLLYERPDEVLMEQAETGVHLGQDLVGGIVCEHLAFQQQDVDWQVWIEAGEHPVPRKLVITSRDAEGHPQFTAQIRSFEDNPKLPPEHFRFTPPEGAERIDFLVVEEGAASKEAKP